MASESIAHSCSRNNCYVDFGRDFPYNCVECSLHPHPPFPLPHQVLTSVPQTLSTRRLEEWSVKGDINQAYLIIPRNLRSKLFTENHSKTDSSTKMSRHNLTSSCIVAYFELDDLKNFVSGTLHSMEVDWQQRNQLSRNDNICLLAPSCLTERIKFSAVFCKFPHCNFQILRPTFLDTWPVFSWIWRYYLLLFLGVQTC